MKNIFIYRRINTALLTIFLVITFSKPVFSQTMKYDRIYRQDQTFFDANILSEDSLDIKYKKIDKTDNTIYVIPKSEVSVIKYANGKTEVFNSESDVSIKAPPEKKAPVIAPTSNTATPVINSKLRSGSNTIGLYMSAGTVLGNSSNSDNSLYFPLGTAENFPLGTCLGGSLQVQHFLADSNKAVYLNIGFLQWQTDITNTILDVDLASIQMNAESIQLGIKYYKKYFYAALEAGVFLTQKTISSNDAVFLVAEPTNVSKISPSFSPCIGYELMIGKRSNIDINLRYQYILYPNQSIGFIGLRAGYTILF